MFLKRLKSPDERVLIIMGQREILDFLAKNPNKEFTKYQIEDGLGRTRGSLDAVLVTLRKNGEVQYHKGPRFHSGGKLPFYYKHKNNEDFKVILREQNNSNAKI